MSLLPSRQLLTQSRFLTPNQQNPLTYSELDPDYEYLDNHKLIQQQQAQQEEDTSLLEDLGMGLLSGAEGFARSAIGFVDMLLFDALPEEWEQRKFDRPDSVFGGLVEGVTQFGLGLIPGFGVAGILGKGAKLAGMSQKALKTTKSIATGVAADFIAFDEHEARLSDFLVEHELTNNVITEYLASDEEDSAFEGRMKNALEGGALGALADVLIKGVKTVKKGKKVDGSPEAKAALVQAQNELEEALISSGTVTRTGLDLQRQVSELSEEAAQKVRNEINDPTINFPKVPEAEVDPTNLNPKYPDC